MYIIIRDAAQYFSQLIWKYFKISGSNSGQIVTSRPRFIQENKFKRWMRNWELCLCHKQNKVPRYTHIKQTDKGKVAIH